MLKYICKVATWNMQKGQVMEAVGNESALEQWTRDARNTVLGHLTANHDYIFAQESAQQIRLQTQQANFVSPDAQEKEWMSYHQNDDNQAHQSANRPAIFSNTTMRPAKIPHDCPVNGSEDSFRLSAMGWACTSVGNGLFVSLHATSGWGAKQNTEAYLLWLCKWLKKNEMDFAVIGADFNHTPCANSAIVDGCKLDFSLPQEMTHQCGSVLDGFCSIIVNPAITASWNKPLRLVTSDANWGDETKMVQVDQSNPQPVNARGYLAMLKRADSAAMEKLRRVPEYWVHLSDHCPVVAQLELTRQSP